MPDTRGKVRNFAAHLAEMALFKVNTGTREQEVCRLRWDWEIEVPELGGSVFLIPADFGGRTENSGVKNGEDRLVVLNDVACSVVESCRGKHPERVFTFEIYKRLEQDMERVKKILKIA